MPNDRVTIDPEFRRSKAKDERGRSARFVGFLAVVAAAFVFGWLLGSPSGTEPPPPNEAATATEPASATPDASSESRPSTTTSTTPPVAGLDVPLAEAIPGFTDTVTIVSRGNPTGTLLQWKPMESVPETATSFPDNQPPWFNGVDAGGNWYLLQDDGILSIARVAQSDDAQTWPPPSHEIVAARVASSAWHDTDPGRLAWLACPRSPQGLATLFTLDVDDTAAEPVPVGSIDHPCEGNPGIWLGGWGNWGFIAGVDVGTDPPIDVLYGTDGIEIARSDRLERLYFVAGSPDGTTTWADHSSGAGGPQAFRLSASGDLHGPVPGLAEDELLTGALWSPNGDHVAMTVERSDVPIFRVVDAVSGTVIGQAAGDRVRPQTWSSDGRFVGFERFPDDGSGFELAIYDTSADATVAVTIPRPVTQVQFAAAS